MLKYINSDDGADVILDVLDQLDLKDKVFKTDAEEELPAAFLASLRSAAVDLSLSSPERSKESIVRGVTERLNRTRWGTVEMFGREVFMQDAPSLTKNGKAIYGERKNFQGKQIERAVEIQVNSVIKSSNMEPEVARAFSRNVKETLRVVPTKVDGKTVYTPSYRPEGGGEEFFYVNTPEGPDVLTINVDRNIESGVIKADMQTTLDNVAHDLVTMGLEDRKGPVEGFFDNSRPDITGRSGTGKELKQLNKEMQESTFDLMLLEEGQYEGDPAELLVRLKNVQARTEELENSVLRFKAWPDAPMEAPGGVREGSVESSMEITSEEVFQVNIPPGGSKAAKEEVMSHLNGNLSDVGVAAVMGNIEAEAGPMFDPQQKQKGGGPGRGLFQMESPMRRSFEKKFGKDFSAENQIKFVLDEIENGDHIGPGNAKKIRKAFASGDLEEATKAFTRYFENPRDQSEKHLNHRVKLAKKYMKDSR